MVKINRYWKIIREKFKTEEFYFGGHRLEHSSEDIYNNFDVNSRDHYLEEIKN